MVSIHLAQVSAKLWVMSNIIVVSIAFQTYFVVILGIWDIVVRTGCNQIIRVMV